MDLTLKEMIILIAAIVIILSLILSILKHSIRIALVVAICAILFCGFTWLPEKIKEWTKSPLEPGQVDEVVDTVKEEWEKYADSEGKSWADSAKSLWEKLTGGNNQEEPAQNPQP